jgi:hypothetical protein
MIRQPLGIDDLDAMAFHVECGMIVSFGHHDVRELLRAVVL